MEIKGFGLGIRFDLLHANMLEAETDMNVRRILEEIFSVLTATDLKGMYIHGGMEKNCSDDYIYIVVISGGSLKEMRRIYRKLEDDAAIDMYLAHANPYIENNRLAHINDLDYFGRVHKDGRLLDPDKNCFDLRVPLRHGRRRPVGKGIKILLAPDSYKGTISSADAIKRLTFAARRHFPGVKIVPVPIADGGEGTVHALVTAGNGAYRNVDVTGPLGNKVNACYGVLRGKTAIIEMAEASGMGRVDMPDIMKASTIGTGELIRRALNEGLHDIVIGIGGSATNDCGMGCARALGVKFFDEDGNELCGCGGELGLVKKIDMEYLHPLIKNAKFTIMCDANNPLLGENGATYVYGPQKGANAEQLNDLERGMTSFATLLCGTIGRDVAHIPGAGAAGGLGAMLMALLNPQIKCGIDAMLDAVDFEKLLHGVALVVTGEGRLDEQSVRCGKAVSGIMRRCAARNIPVAVITGSMQQGADELYELGNASIMTTINAPMSLETALADAEHLFDDAADRMFRFIRMGRDVEKIGAPKKPKVATFPPPPQLYEENISIARELIGIEPKHTDDGK
ncbi:MAG: glycerate kinase [Clostridia bacterium]